MSDRLTAEPGTLEFLKQLLEIAQESDHPMDKALTRVLAKQIGEAEVEVEVEAVQNSAGGGNNGQLDNAHYAD